MSQTERLIISLAEVNLDSLSCVGGKNASLGEMIRELDAVGVRVPEGFALTTYSRDSPRGAGPRKVSLSLERPKIRKLLTGYTHGTGVGVGVGPK